MSHRDKSVESMLDLWYLGIGSASAESTCGRRGGSDGISPGVACCADRIVRCGAGVPPCTGIVGETPVPQMRETHDTAVMTNRTSAFLDDRRVTSGSVSRSKWQMRMSVYLAIPAERARRASSLSRRDAGESIRCYRNPRGSRICRGHGSWRPRCLRVR